MWKPTVEGGRGVQHLEDAVGLLVCQDPQHHSPIQRAACSIQCAKHRHQNSASQQREAKLQGQGHHVGAISVLAFAALLAYQGSNFRAPLSLLYEIPRRVDE